MLPIPTDRLFKHSRHLINENRYLAGLGHIGGLSEGRGRWVLFLPLSQFSQGLKSGGGHLTVLTGAGPPTQAHLIQLVCVSDTTSKACQ